MTAPVWMNAVIGDFGRAAKLNGLALNERGAASLKFENGVTLRFEYTGSELVVAVTLPSADVKRLLSASHYRARRGLRVRAGIVPKTREAVMAVRMAEREVTLPRVSAVFERLWRLAGDIGGSSWV